jgi:tRNA pseudouridine32 synthase/23S rRNA pseudouridine746 synthase
MHQLRAHLAAIGRPIAGDGKYGGLFDIGGTTIPRLMLHASALDIPHPDGKMRCFRAALPPDFASVEKLLGLDAASCA